MIQEPTWPALRLQNIVKSDSTVYNPPIRQIHAGTDGNIKVEDTEGNVVIFKNVIAGTPLGPFFVSKVYSTDTTCSDMVAFI